MPYSTEEQVKAAADSVALELDDSDRIAAGQAWGDPIIDMRLAAKYPVPFDPVPPLVSQISADLAAYHAITAAYFGGGADNTPNGAIHLKNRAYETIEMLVGNRPGELPVSAEPTTSPYSAGGRVRNTVLENFDLVNLPSVPGVPFACPERRPGGGWLR